MTWEDTNRTNSSQLTIMKFDYYFHYSSKPWSQLYHGSFLTGRWPLRCSCVPHSHHSPATVTKHAYALSGTYRHEKVRCLWRIRCDRLANCSAVSKGQQNSCCWLVPCKILHSVLSYNLTLCLARWISLQITSLYNPHIFLNTCWIMETHIPLFDNMNIKLQ